MPFKGFKKNVALSKTCVRKQLSTKVKLTLSPYIYKLNVKNIDIIFASLQSLIS